MQTHLAAKCFNRTRKNALKPRKLASHRHLDVSAHISQGRGTVPEIHAGNKKLAELCHASLPYGGELRDGPKEARWRWWRLACVL